MSLLEALVALVILGLTAAGYLDVFASGARSAGQAAEWDTLTSVAESTMEGAALGDALQAQQAWAALPDGYARQVTVTPWRPGVSDVAVTVTSPRGTTFTVHRLMREARAGGPR